MDQQRHIVHAHFHLPSDAEPELFEQLLDLAEGLTPRFQALPPDAIDLDFTGSRTYFGRDALGLTQMLRMRALALHGVPVTAGSASNRMLAAMAAASSPPGHITDVGHDQAAIDAFLRPRPIAALYGVGPATAATLARHGLHTIGTVADTPLFTLQRLLGSTAGRDLHTHARGHDPRPVTPHSPNPSLSAHRLFSQDELDPDQHRRALLSIAEQLGSQLRQRREVCRTLTLTVRYADRTSTTKSRTLPEATSHSASLTRAAYDLYAAYGLERARVRAIALRAHGLSSAGRAHHQLTLDASDDKARGIEVAADRARARYGPEILQPATLVSRPTR